MATMGALMPAEERCYIFENTRVQTVREYRQYSYAQYSVGESDGSSKLLMPGNVPNAEGKRFDSHCDPNDQALDAMDGVCNPPPPPPAPPPPLSPPVAHGAGRPGRDRTPAQADHSQLAFIQQKLVLASRS